MAFSLDATYEFNVQSAFSGFVVVVGFVAFYYCCCCCYCGGDDGGGLNTSHLGSHLANTAAGQLYPFYMSTRDRFV